MIVYNITTKVPWAIAEQWLNWQKDTYIPEMMQTRLCAEYKLFRLLDQDDEEGPTFALQIFFPDTKNYEGFIRDHAALFSKKSTEQWGHNCIGFKSSMQLIH